MMVLDEKFDNLKVGGVDVCFLFVCVLSVIVESLFGCVFLCFYIWGYGNIDFDLNLIQFVFLVYDDIFYENLILKGYFVFDMVVVEVFCGF